jgi:hypothetical protein
MIICEIKPRNKLKNTSLSTQGKNVITRPIALQSVSELTVAMNAYNVLLIALADVAKARGMA